MELIALLYFSVVFSVSSLIALFSYAKYSKYPIHLIIGYLIIILLGLGTIGIRYCQLTKLNTITIPFTQTTGNTLTFSFAPEKRGKYSLDLTFLNKEINKKYEACEFFWEKGDKTICKNSLLYRAISIHINNKHYHIKNIYQKFNDNYGFNNHALKDPSLQLATFRGKINEPIAIQVKIDATPSEIQTTKPAIVIGADEESFMSLDRIFLSFVFIAVPFIFAIVILLFSIIKNLFKN